MPSERTAPNLCRLTMHLCKEGSSLPIKGSFKGLLGEMLVYLKRKHDDNLKLVVLDEFTMITKKYSITFIIDYVR